MVVCIKKQNKKDENLIETIYDNWARRKGRKLQSYWCHVL